MTRLRTALLAVLLGAAALAGPAAATHVPGAPEVQADERDVCVWTTRNGERIGYCLRY